MPTITKNANGSYTVSDIIDNQLVKQSYYFFTRQQALSAFKKYLKANCLACYYEQIEYGAKLCPDCYFKKYKTLK